MSHSCKRVEDSQVLISQLMLPSYSNFGGKIHGGYILSLMDQIAFACASKHSGHYCVTASVDTVDFLSPIEIGELVSMKASINYTGRTSMVVGIRVEAENIKTGEIKHCNSSYFTMVAKNESGKNEQVPGICIENEDQLRRFVKALKRRTARRAREAEFDHVDFMQPKYLNLLQGENVHLADTFH